MDYNSFYKPNPSSEVLEVFTKLELVGLLRLFFLDFGIFKCFDSLNELLVFNFNFYYLLLIILI